MNAERYVILGLAAVRSQWFIDLSRWSTMGSIPVEFIKCVSADELRARLESGRAFSALLVDLSTGAIDRDLLDRARLRHASVIAVDEGRSHQDVGSLGVAALLSSDFDRERLLETLASTSHMIGGATALPFEDAGPDVGERPLGRMIAVTGPGGTGASSVAIALAQALVGLQRTVVLADLRLYAEQAMLHDARDIVPGVQELVEAHRSGRPTVAEVHALTFRVTTRDYHLLLGLRRHRDWTILRTRAVEAAIIGLRTSFDVVVADVDAEVEGEAETGSVEIEERNLLARTVMQGADTIVVVGRPGVKGIHALARVLNDLRSFGVPADGTLAVINGLARLQSARAEYTRTIADLTGASAGLAPIVGPVFLPPRRNLDDLHRDGSRLPASLAAPVLGAIESMSQRLAPRSNPGLPTPVVAGSLGEWADQEATG